MDKITIRRATAEDLPHLLRFEQGVINAERAFDPTLKRERTTYYDFAALLTLPHCLLLVAEKGTALVGSGYARIEAAKPYLQHTQYAYLGFMYVEPLYRGQGINKMIMEALEKWTLAQGIREQRLDVYYDNEAAIKAYEKAGFTRHMIEMRKPVGQDKNQ